MRRDTRVPDQVFDRQLNNQPSYIQTKAKPNQYKSWKIIWSNFVSTLSQPLERTHVWRKKWLKLTSSSDMIVGMRKSAIGWQQRVEGAVSKVYNSQSYRKYETSVRQVL